MIYRSFGAVIQGKQQENVSGVEGISLSVLATGLLGQLMKHHFLKYLFIYFVGFDLSSGI